MISSSLEFLGELLQGKAASWSTAAVHIEVVKVIDILGAKSKALEVSRIMIDRAVFQATAEAMVGNL